jgi:cell division protein DivIC
MRHKNAEDIKKKRMKLQLKVAKSPNHINRSRKRIIIVIVFCIIAFVAVSIKNIVSLQMEQMELKEKNRELVSERNELKSKLKNIDNPEYIKEEARKKLRLVSPDEILFIFKDEAKESNKDK